MTSAAKIGDLAFRLLHGLLFNLGICIAIPFAFIAVFWGCSAIDQPAPDRGQVAVDQPVRPHHPLTATIR